MNTARVWFGLLLVVIIGTGISFAMPPSPQLLEQIRTGQIPMPYYLTHQEEYRARGFNNPPPRTHRLRSTDETDTTIFRAIVLLVDFSDQAGRVAPSYFDSLLYGSATGTVRNYYNQVSYGTWQLSTNTYPSTIGWVRLPHTYSYYVNGQYGQGNYPQNAARMVEDAIRAVDTLVNFSQCHRDANGYVDGLIVVHSGRGAEITSTTNDIWSHMGQLNSTITVDGVRIRYYCTEPEYWQQLRDMTCGVFCHEMGHLIFGIPDLYDTDYSSTGVGRWCLMAAGSWGGSLGNSPAHPSAPVRYWMEFATPINVTTPLVNDSIRSVESRPIIYRLAANSSATSLQYFLVENRQRTGYDASLPASGLLIWHIDESTAQSGNRNEWYPGHTSSGHFLAALEQADGAWHMERNTNSGDAGDPFPGSTVKRDFTNATTPNSRSYGGSATRVAVTNISDAGAIMTATLQTNGATIVLVTPNGGEQWAVGASNPIQWAASSITGSKTIRINRHYPTGTWDSITTITNTTDTIYNWRITGDTTSSARIRIHTNSMTPQIVGESDASFSIGLPTLSVRRPNGGELYPIGETHGIFWNSSGVTGNLLIQINRNYPTGSWDSIATAVSTTNQYLWGYPGPATANARIRIRTTQMAIVICDTSDADFTIYDPNSVKSTANAPTKFGLAEIYPNPFNATTTIRFSVPNRSDVDIRAYDIAGREIASIAHQTYAAGSYSIGFDGKALSSGLYFFKMNAGTEVAIRKVMLVK